MSAGRGLVVVVVDRTVDVLVDDEVEGAGDGVLVDVDVDVDVERTTSSDVVEAAGVVFAHATTSTSVTATNPNRRW
jgi:hypothetical protein